MDSAPLKVIHACVHGTIYTNNLEELRSLHIPMTSIKKSMKNIHILAIKYIIYMVIIKHKLVNKQAPIIPLSRD